MSSRSCPDAGRREHAALRDLVHHAAQQRAGQPARSSPLSSISGPAARRLTPSSHSMTSTCSVHSSSCTAGITTGTRRPRHAAVPARWRPWQLCCGPPPGSRVLPGCGGKPAGDADRADRARPAGALLEPGRQAQQDVQVLLNGGADPGRWTFTATVAPGRRRSAAGPCAPGRSTRPRPAPAAAPRKPRRRRPERLGYHLLHLLPRRRLGPVLEPGELGGELLREQVTARGQELAQLDEGHPALLQRTPQRRRERGPPLRRLPRRSGRPRR